MRIENSPFHISKSKVSSVEENSQLENQKVLNDKNVNKPEKNASSFWDWFRGLVNPFQNLPILSGIYSSINSEDNKSDRDLVQNTLGGFMYGGPIGAIAGFKFSWTAGVGLGLKLRDNIVVPFGGSTTGITLCIPKAFFMLPLICLNFGTLNSANERIKTKKAINSVAISAKVAIQAGAPLGGHSGHSCSSSSVEVC